MEIPLSADLLTTDFKPESIYICFEAFPRPKGASSHIASMVEAMSKTFGSVLLISLGYADLPAFQVEGNIYIKRYKQYHPNMLKRAEGFAEFISDTLARYGENVKLTVYRDPWSGAPAVTSGIPGKKIFEVNALPSWELEYTYPNIKKKVSLMTKITDIENLCLRNSDAILTVSDVTAKALTSKGVKKEICAIPNSAHNAFFSPDTCAIDELDYGKWFGYFGSLHSWQGVEVAIDAFAMIADELHDYNMLIVTGGKKLTRKMLRKRIRKKGLEDRILFIPSLPTEELAAAVNKLDFTLCPLVETSRNTYQGCCPIKIVESMAAGKPVIASDLEVCRKLIKNNEDGLLVPAGSKRRWGHAILDLANNQELLNKLSKNARITATQDFSREHIHAELKDYFLHTLSH